MSRGLLFVLLVTTGCVGQVQRSARVPHPTVPMSSGQPMTSTAELTAGLGNLADFIKPGVGDATQAVEVPGTEMRDELRFRVGRDASLGVMYDQGFASTSHKPDPTQAPIGKGDVHGYGVLFDYAIPTATPGFSIATHVELATWSTPYVEYKTCDFCQGTTVEHGRANPVTLGIGVTPSYRTGAVTVFGGLFARNHPTTTRKDADVLFDVSDDGDVHNGPFNLLVEAGVEVALNDWLSALAVVHQDTIRDPVSYGPGVGLALTAKLGRQ